MTTELSPPEDEPLRLLVDIPVTRRKNMTFVMSDEKTVLWSGLYVNDALLYLLETGRTHVWVISPMGFWRLEFSRPLTQEEVSTWLGLQPL